jgi:predicted RNase H-like nuclease (RuvC/YqgF family)
MITSLNRIIYKLQHQIDDLTHRGDCHNQENPLQKIVDEFTAKKLELEAKLMQMTEKATSLAEELQQFKERLENQLKNRFNYKFPRPQR